MLGQWYVYFVCMYTLLKVVSRYDLSVLCLSVPKNVSTLAMVCVVDSNLFFFFNLFNFAKPLSNYV